MKNGKNYDKKRGKTETANRSHYRKEMERAAQDREFIKDNKDIMRDFAFLDQEVFDMLANDTLSSNTDKPIYRRDEKGIFRLYPDGRKKYVREKRLSNSRLRGLA